MATVRVFLLTYRRPNLLRRALRSLIAQTFTDWKCEVHNDAPEDPVPSQVIAELSDPRVQLIQHTRNLGPVASFNLAYAGGTEPYTSILEDDNWWEQDFLKAAIATLAANPSANVVWSNMRIWRELPDSSWQDTQETIWDTDGPEPIARYRWPQPIQMTDAIHSHGAMIVRTQASIRATVPEETPLAIIEHLRERLISGEWILLRRPLANFAQTTNTARSKDRIRWAQAQAIIAASWLQERSNDEHTLREIWGKLRSSRPRATGVLFHVGISGVRSSDLLRHAKPGDWLHFLATSLRHPVTFFRIQRYRQELPRIWVTACEGARAREAELTAAPRHADKGCFTKRRVK